jgi:enoyl-CoA hydratase
MISEPMISEPVLVRRQGAVGRLTLNRPRSLNALSLDMIRLIAAALDEWEHDDAVRTVVLDGAGERGLCAGGDVRFMVEDAADPASEGHQAAVLLAEEYRLDARIARYPKPYVALMDGVVMGGGVGLSAHRRLRVATPRTRIAMPEVTLGYVPDVGGTWLLAHTPGEIGTHVALTSARLTAADAVYCGLADVVVGEETLGALVEGLAAGGDPDEVAGRLAVDPGPAPIAEARDWIDAAYCADNPSEIVAALRDGGHHEPADAIGKASPLAVTVTLRALREARALPDLEHALAAEYRLSRCCVRWPDFTEGVRATLVDRNRAPRWCPSTPEGITDDVLARFADGTRDSDPALGLT